MIDLGSNTGSIIYMPAAWGKSLNFFWSIKHSGIIHPHGRYEESMRECL